MANQKKLAYNKKYGKVVRQLDSGDYIGGIPGYGGMGSTGAGAGSGGIDPFGGYLTQEIDTMSGNPSGRGISALTPNYDRIYGGEQRYLHSGMGADGNPFQRIITQKEYDSMDLNTRSNTTNTPISYRTFQNYQDAKANQDRRTTELASGFVNPQAAVSRQEYYNQQAQKGPEKDWNTYPKESDYDSDGDGNLTRDERTDRDWETKPEASSVVLRS